MQPIVRGGGCQTLRLKSIGRETPAHRSVKNGSAMNVGYANAGPAAVQGAQRRPVHAPTGTTRRAQPIGRRATPDQKQSGPNPLRHTAQVALGPSITLHQWVAVA